MSDKELFDFTTEVDPDYVGQKADEPDHRPKPARITTKKAWFMSLLLPILSILASVYPIMNGIIFPTMILGLIFGGIVPLVMIIAELIFAAAQKTDPKTKLCLALSSAAWVYLGFAINLILFFGSARFY